MIVGALALSAASLFARIVTGSVVDETGAAFPYVNVLLYCDSTFVEAVVSDAEGRFAFADTDVAANRLELNAPGYEHEAVAVASDGNAGRIEMRPRMLMMNEVEVKGERPVVALKKGVLVANVENSLLASAGSADDVLRSVPMVAEVDGKFAVFGKGEAIIYINGREVRDPAEVTQLASADVKEVQVVANPGPQYGSDVNAVIRIITKKPAGEGLSLQAVSNTYFDANVSPYVYAGLKYRTGGLEIFGNGSFFNLHERATEDHTMTRYGGGTPISSSDIKISSSGIENTPRGKVGFNYQPTAAHSFGAYYQWVSQRSRSNSDFATEITERGVLTETSTSKMRRTATKMPGHNVNVYYSGQLGKFALDFNGDYVFSRQKESAIQNERNSLSGDREITTDNRTRNRLLAEKLTAGYGAGNFSVQLGEEFTRSQRSNNFENPQEILRSERNEITENNLGIFAEAAYGVGSFNASAGVRYEHLTSEYRLDGKRMDAQSKTYDRVFPSVALSYARNGFNYALSYSSRSERPTYSMLSGNYIYMNSLSYTRGNPNLRRSIIHELTAMASWKFVVLMARYSHTIDEIMQVCEPYGDSELITVFTTTNVPKYDMLTVAANVSPVFGVYHPSLSVDMSKPWFSLGFNGSTNKFSTPIFSMQFKNSFELPHDWVVEANVWVRSKGNIKNMSARRWRSSVSLRVYKMFFKKTLGVYLKAADIFNGMKDANNLYSENAVFNLHNDYHTRNIELTLRYNFNASKSRYKGTGAGEAEKARF